VIDLPRDPRGGPVVPRSTWSAGATALRRFWRPFLLIQAAALVLAIAYRVSGPFRGACAVAASWKATGGVWFSMGTTALAGGLLPELAKLLADRTRTRWRGRGGAILFNVLIFAFDGLVVDGLYRGEARLLGAEVAPATVVAKVAFDQLVFSPPWTVLLVLLFRWQQRSFALVPTLRALGQRSLYRRVLSILIPNWLFWIPMVSIIYAMPVPLQFLLFIPVLGAWSLIITFIATAPDDEG
jgi:hypothetical protein